MPPRAGPFDKRTNVWRCAACQRRKIKVHTPGTNPANTTVLCALTVLVRWLYTLRILQKDPPNLPSRYGAEEHGSGIRTLPSSGPNVTGSAESSPSS